MENAIIKKLKKLSGVKNYSEQDVVYFLVEYFKLLELKQLEKSPDFKVIKFYRNWSCHAHLERYSEIFGEIKKDVKNRIIESEKYFNVQEIKEKSDNEALIFMENIVSKFDASAFKKDFKFRMLKEKIEELANTLLDGDVPEWKSFFEQLPHIIADTPLVITDNKKEIFRFEFLERNLNYPFNKPMHQIIFPGCYIGGGAGDDFFDF